MALVCVHPLFVTQVLTTGPDASFVLIAVAGALGLFSVATTPGASWRVGVASGLSLGAACWIRYHGLSWGIAVLLAAPLVGLPASRRRVATVGLAFAAPAALLGALGLAADDLGAIGRDQAFNVYSRLVHPVNWFHLDREPIPRTILEAVGRDPAAFWRNYVAFSAPHVFLGLATVAAAVLGRGLARRFALFVLLVGVAFVPLVNLGASPRGVASYVPLVLMAVVWVAMDAIHRIPGPRLRMAAAALAVVCTGAFVWRAWIPENRGFLEAARYRSTLAQQVEQILREDRVKVATQVFSVEDFYFVNAPGWHVGNYYPRIKGGWPTLDLPGFLETYPPPSTESLDAFLNDCQRFGISHLVLSDASGVMMRELGQLFDGRLTSPRTLDIGGVPGVRVFRIVG